MLLGHIAGSWFGCMAEVDGLYTCFVWNAHPGQLRRFLGLNVPGCPAVEVPPLPVPNLGYACLNSTLQAEKPVVTNNRGAILRTYNEKGLGYISELALQNCKDLLPIVQWNHEHAIRLFRYYIYEYMIG